jgi:hypothetical protein
LTTRQIRGYQLLDASARDQGFQPSYGALIRGLSTRSPIAIHH